MEPYITNVLSSVDGSPASFSRASSLLASLLHGAIDAPSLAHLWVQHLERAPVHTARLHAIFTASALLQLACAPAAPAPCAGRCRAPARRARAPPRRPRPPAPALLQRDAEGRAVVELAAVEAGVSPGQACVFYESAEPLARVLGGGFIAATDMVAPLISTPISQAAASA